MRWRIHSNENIVITLLWSCIRHDKIYTETFIFDLARMRSPPNYSTAVAAMMTTTAAAVAAKAVAAVGAEPATNICSMEERIAYVQQLR